MPKAFKFCYNLIYFTPEAISLFPLSLCLFKTFWLIRLDFCYFIIANVTLFCIISIPTVSLLFSLFCIPFSFLHRFLFLFCFHSPFPWSAPVQPPAPCLLFDPRYLPRFLLCPSFPLPFQSVLDGRGSLLLFVGVKQSEWGELGVQFDAQDRGHSQLYYRWEQQHQVFGANHRNHKCSYYC